MSFVNSAHTLIKSFGFDGLDLAWEFPETKPKKIRSTLGSFWHSLKKKVVGDKVIDDKAAEHKEQFTALVREIKNVFRHDGLLLSLSVLPNVNSSGEYYFKECRTSYWFSCFILSQKEEKQNLENKYDNTKQN